MSRCRTTHVQERLSEFCVVPEKTFAPEVFAEPAATAAKTDSQPSSRPGTPSTSTSPPLGAAPAAAHPAVHGDSPAPDTVRARGATWTVRPTAPRPLAAGPAPTLSAPASDRDRTSPRPVTPTATARSGSLTPATSMLSLATAGVDPVGTAGVPATQQLRGSLPPSPSPVRGIFVCGAQYFNIHMYVIFVCIFTLLVGASYGC